MAHILIIEDDTSFSELLTNFLKKNGHTITTAFNVKEANIRLKEGAFDLVLLDYRLPDGTGMDVLTTIRLKTATLQVIIMTSFHDIRTAVQSIRSGAYDYITKPINPDELKMVVQEALAKNDSNKPAVQETKAPFIEGISNTAKQINDYVRLVAPTEMTLIIQGESGTGKEQVARTIHNLSKRAKGPFVAIDCGALSTELAGSELFGHVKGAFTGALQDKTGQFVVANNGTLFLDEVGNLSYDIQVKLLRALQEREIQPVGSTKNIKINVRIISATNDDLLNSVRNGKFREDLYHRLNEFKLQLPALKDRPADMDLFIDHFISQANSELGKDVSGVSPEVRELFERYDWPGNLRELKNTIKRAVLLAKTNIIMIHDLPAEMNAEAIAQTGPDLKMMQATNEKEFIIKTLQEVRYNKSKAAKLLNIDRKTLYYKMAKYNIEG